VALVVKKSFCTIRLHREMYSILLGLGLVDFKFKFVMGMHIAAQHCSILVFLPFAGSTQAC
jgi:hypothetical protein